MSFLETLVCLLVALIVLGPKRLPAAARKVGHWVGLFRRASEEFQRQIMMMDQTVNEKVNRAVQDFDTLVPSDEEVHAALDFSADLPPDAPMPYPYADPPAASPDAALAAEPLPGGLPVEPGPPPASEPEPESAPAPAPKPAAHQPYGGKRKSDPPKPRSLGLSPTPPAAKEVTRG